MVGLVGAGQLQHAAKLWLHSCSGANCFFGRNAHCISFQGVQYILVTCIRFSEGTNNPMVIAKGPRDELFPLSLPFPTQLIKRTPNADMWMKRVVASTRDVSDAVCPFAGRKSLKAQNKLQVLGQGPTSIFIVQLQIQVKSQNISRWHQTQILALSIHSLCEWSTSYTRRKLRSRGLQSFDVRLWFFFSVLSFISISKVITASIQLNHQPQTNGG